jgi:hypothetical protein
MAVRVHKALQFIGDDPEDMSVKDFARRQSGRRITTLEVGVSQGTARGVV